MCSIGSTSLVSHSFPINSIARRVLKCNACMLLSNTKPSLVTVLERAPTRVFSYRHHNAHGSQLHGVTQRIGLTVEALIHFHELFGYVAPKVSGYGSLGVLALSFPEVIVCQ